MNVGQIVSAAGDANASLAAYGDVPVTVVTKNGNTRSVTSAGFFSGLVLSTGEGRTLTVQRVVEQAGDPRATLSAYGTVEVTVRSAKGNPRQVTGAAYRNGSLVLTTGK